MAPVIDSSASHVSRGLTFPDCSDFYKSGPHILPLDPSFFEQRLENVVDHRLADGAENIRVGHRWCVERTVPKKFFRKFDGALFKLAVFWF